MEAKNTTKEDYAKMNETEWVKNKKSIMQKLTGNRESVNILRENLIAEKKKLTEEEERLEHDNYTLLSQVKELELKHHGKSSTRKKLNTQLQALKKKLVKPLTEENSYWSEVRFLESEKTRLYDLQDDASEKLNRNMAALSGTIMEIEFMKGEITTLMNKIGMIESELPEVFGEVENLDEKIALASRSLNELFTRMKNVEKDVKILYYEKE